MNPISLKAACFVLLATLVYCQSSHAALIAYWNFDEGSGLTANDTSGNVNNHNGTLQGGTETPAWVPGRVGSALGFSWTTAPGAGGKRVVVPFHTDLQLNGPFTVSYWYRMDAATPAGTFPGIMRIGSQSTTSGNNIGWGFFRTGNMVHKRGNHQPGVFGAMNVGQWYHLALRYDGAPGANNNTAYLNGVPVNFTTNWAAATATTVFEIGRMDQFDTATLDDLSLWNEAVAPGKIRSLYTVPTSLFLDYDLADLRAVWAIFDGGAGSSGTVEGTTWSYAASVPGSATPGDAYFSGGLMYIVLGNGTGVSAPITILTGSVSPGGVGIVGSFPLVGMPTITVSNASLHFDLSEDNTPGGTFNDLIDVTGDLNIVNSTISIGPLAALPAGTYRLFNYTGTKTGSLTIVNNTRYSLMIDESTAGQINLVVSGTPGVVRWNSTSSGAWDLTTSNWFNEATMAADRFFQGDAVIFDDAGAFQTNISVPGAVFTHEILVNSSRNYSFTGAGQIAGNDEGLLKQGTGILTIGTANTFVGEVNVAQGTLRLGNSAALGATSGGTTVANGATLDLGGNSPGTEPVTVEGAGVNSAGAVVNTGAALSNNGLRGVLTLTGDTTFGGVNRWDVFGGTLVGNNHRLTKVGGPEIALSNLGDTGLGPIDIQQGILTLLGNTTPGDATQPITVNTNAVLAFWATGPTVLDKPVVLNQAIMRNNTSGGTDVSTNLGAVTLNGDVTFQTGANIALLGAVGGSGNLIKASAGTLYLGGANTYSGNTVVNAGRLALLDGGSIANTPRITVGSGTTFDASRLAAGFSLSSDQIFSGSGSIAGSLNVPAGTVIPGSENVAATLGVSADLALSGGTVTYDLAAAVTEGGGVNDLINVGGNLDFSGTTLTTINLNPIGLLTVGNTYTLINYTGTLTGSDANLAVATSSRYMFSISIATPGKVTVTVMGGEAGDLIWLGDVFGSETLWDLQTTMNWSDSFGNPATFFGGDRVKFDDFALTNVVDLVGTLTPASILVENGSVDYVFQGSGKLSGNSALTKTFGSKLSIVNSGANDFIGPVTVDQGTLEVGNGATSGNLGSGSIAISNSATLIYNRSDTLTLNNSLSGHGNLIKQNNNLMVIPGAQPGYEGTLTMNGGTLRPGNAASLGTANGGTVIASGATLDVNAQNLGAESVTAAGAGPTGAGAIVNNAGGQNNALRFVTLTGDTTVGGSGRWDIRANPTASLSTGGNPYGLTKVGNNQVSLVDVAVDPALGDINVMAGIFAAELGTTSGDETKTINVANNATLQFWARTVPWNKVHVLNGGRNIFNGNGATTMGGSVTLNGTVTFEVAGTSLTVTAPIGGSGALTKTGGSPLILLEDNTYPGATTVSAGTLQLGNGTNAGWVAGNIAMGGNTLTVYRSDTVTVSNTLTGTGTLNVRTPNGLVIGNNTVNFGVINLGLTTPGRLVLMPGFTGNIGALSAGDSPGNSPGDLHQFGGTLNISGLCRIGHWPNETSTYLMGGGALNVTATPGGTVNLGGQPEQPGVIYLGVDGTGVLIQTGGVVRAHGIVFDGRGNTAAGVDTYTLTGGEIIVGPSGFKSGALDANTSYAINLGGGKITSAANWTSVLRMDLNGENGNTTFDTAGFSNVLSGALTGIGGLTKRGSGTLAITGTANYEGPTEIGTGGTLLVRGSLGSGIGLVTAGVDAGPVPPALCNLAGDGTINDPVAIYNAGRISPGSTAPSVSASIATLTINNVLTVDEGIVSMEVSKSGSGIASDRIVVSDAFTYGGTLDLRVTGDPLAAGDVIDLFDALSFQGSFELLGLPLLPAGLYWDTSRLAVDGTIRVTGPQITFSRAGADLSLSWPADVMLQAQTNAPGVGLNSANWVTLDPGTNSITFTIDPTVGSVFYRLIRQ